MGAAGAFIMTGFCAFVGGIAGALGLDNGFVLNTLAFGPFMGPHVAFAAGVTAAAYAGRRGKLANGADIGPALYGLKEPDVLLVGGATGVLGYTIAYAIGQIPEFNNLTDRPAFTVITLGILTRLIIGKTGLAGKYEGEGPREWYTTGKGLINNLVWSISMGIVVSFAAASLSDLPNWDDIGDMFHIICFGFSTMTLLFTYVGKANPATHHVTLTCGRAAVIGIRAWGKPGALFGVLFAIIGGLLGDAIGVTCNSYGDTFIDPPAAVIFPMITTQPRFLVPRTAIGPSSNFFLFWWYSPWPEIGPDF
eukprot:Protomagalhaensia_wolfi_Nauph_80__2199@NODE_2420_length_1097_cov_5_083176_g1895_i0_p1_GENE_NODE_2420_length_1097_cov_5_083176_g1895_i0NODE_2420_length_1097_cov_5_083176_g1895_i0_p1_ORF_typecomplete_len345_score31_38_NODE_2420_length_1097_cov_5_083176_g1895_i062982